MGKYSYLLLWLPMALIYILPTTIEDRFYISIGGATFFIFSLIYLIIPFLKPDLHGFIWNKRILVYWVIVLILGIILNISNYRRGNLLNDVTCGLSFVFLIFIFLHAPIEVSQLKKLKIFLIGLFGILSLELVVFALGLSSFEAQRITETTAGVMRIQTTIGAPTATAGIMFVLGGCVFSLLKEKKYKLLFICLWTFVVMLTLSRGSLFGLLAFDAIWLIRNYNLRKNFFRNIAILSIVAGGIYYSNVLDPIIERQKYRAENEDALSGRTDYWEKSINLWVMEPLFGRGVGNVQPRNEFEGEDSLHTFPHNTYLLLLSEQGLTGIILFLCFFIPLFKKLWRYADKDDFILISMIFLSVFNSETMFFFALMEVPLFTLITIAFIKNERNCIYR